MNKDKDIPIGLTVTTGCMYAGKTTELIKNLRRFEYAGIETVLFKPEIDNRYSEVNVVNHDGLKKDAVVLPVDEKCKGMIFEIAKDIKVIGFDEVQFWNENVDMAQLLEDLVNLRGKCVYASLLNRDYRGVPFPVASKLLPLADHIISLAAMCKCGNEATFSQRIDEEGKPIFTGPQLEVGGRELYEAKCRDCFVYPTK